MCNKMSDVRLSNASPTLERVDARQPDSARPRVCRNLFGRPDPGEIRRSVTATVQGEVRAFIETYNFDPVEDRPLTPRNFEWEEDHDAPDYFRRAPHGSQRPQRDTELPRDDTRRDPAESSEGRPERRRGGGGGSRKRLLGASGSCASECPSKKSRTDDDDEEDDEDQRGAGSPAVRAVEQGGGRRRGDAEVR